MACERYPFEVGVNAIAADLFDGGVGVCCSAIAAGVIDARRQIVTHAPTIAGVDQLLDSANFYQLASTKPNGSLLSHTQERLEGDWACVLLQRPPGRCWLRH